MVESVRKISDAQEALGACLRLLRNLDSRGRKKGRDIPPQQFAQELANAYREVAARMGHRPTQYEVAAEMDLPRTTFTDYLRDYRKHGIAWPPKI
jgi:hypothetical protein